MTTDRELLEMALEALTENVVWFSTDTMIGRSLKEKTDKAITSLRQAIERAEKQEPVGYFTINDYDKWEQIDGTSGKPLYEAPQPCQTCEALARTVMMDQTGRDA